MTNVLVAVDSPSVEQQDMLLLQFSGGDRVALAPHLDCWMQGDRYGAVVKRGNTYVHVRCDRSGKVRRLSPEDLQLIDPHTHLLRNR